MVRACRQAYLHLCVQACLPAHRRCRGRHIWPVRAVQNPAVRRQIRPQRKLSKEPTIRIYQIGDIHLSSCKDGGQNRTSPGNQRRLLKRTCRTQILYYQVVTHFNVQGQKLVEPFRTRTTITEATGREHRSGALRLFILLRNFKMNN